MAPTPFHLVGKPHFFPFSIVMGGSSGVPSWYGSLSHDDSVMIHRHAIRFMIRFNVKKDRDVCVHIFWLVMIKIGS